MPSKILAIMVIALLAIDASMDRARAGPELAPPLSRNPATASYVTVEFVGRSSPLMIQLVVNCKSKSGIVLRHGIIDYSTVEKVYCLADNHCEPTPQSAVAAICRAATP